ncbi:MAG: hypothetical protein GVY29_11700 [Spirochaetes bacterium]|jgi:hypothetical protein|nr:hypothetical protein [Spirochaetota bacterium]
MKKVACIEAWDRIVRWADLDIGISHAGGGSDVGAVSEAVGLGLELTAEEDERVGV